MGCVDLALLVGAMAISLLYDLPAGRVLLRADPPDWQTWHTRSVVGIVASVLGAAMSLAAVIIGSKRAKYGLLILTVAFLAAIALFGVIASVTVENPC